MKETERRVLEATVLALCSCAAGATIGLLLAPESGEKTRRKIRRAGRDLSKRAGRLQEDLGHHVHDLVEDSASLRCAHRRRRAGSVVRRSLRTRADLVSRHLGRARELMPC